ncbi:MAG: ribosome maturation factor RimM, partial [Burkholderiales bacterium]
AGLVVRFEGISDRNDAALLKGRDVAVPRSALPATAPDEFYLADLVGLEVENANGERLGTVERLIETGVNAVLVVDGERKQLLPFVENVIRRVDVAAGKVYVEWEGSH